jgi:hypothetical protein
MGRHAAKGLRRLSGSGRGSSSSAVADLQMLIHNRRLLLLSIGAAILPFVVFFLVLIIVSKVHQWALFVAAPLILAAVLVGAIVDHAYARESARG